MKTFAFALFLTLTSTSFAAECVDSKGRDILSNLEAIQIEVAAQSSCGEASALAQACAWGSSADLQTAGTAYEKCSAEFEAQSPSNDLRQLLASMKSQCLAKYQDKEGSMYRSFNAYCHLTALEWITNLATDN